MVRAAALSAALVLAGAASAEGLSKAPYDIAEPLEAAVAGPAATKPAEYRAADLQWSTKPGHNTITGDAVLRTRGGDIRTCAGTIVQLWPVSDYTLETAFAPFTVQHIVRDDQQALWRRRYDPAVTEFVRTAGCNAQGSFSFYDLPDGDYFVVAEVSWEVPSLSGRTSRLEPQGGLMALRVGVRGGVTKSVTLTQ